MRILITGGCGFIGSNFINLLLKNHKEWSIEKIINLDKKTYAGKGENLEHMELDKHPKYILIEGDICDKDLVEKIFLEHKPDILFNFAAESHVDRSIVNSAPFVKTNILGTVVLLDASLKNNLKKFIQISTDEVYGSLNKESPSSKETDILNPRSSYSASKAAAELLTLSYYSTHKLPVLITRSSNNYGPYQFPEKLLPLFITNLIKEKKVPLMWNEENPGLNIRDWLHVEDNCKAIWLISQKGKIGETYNIAGENEKTNIYMTKLMLKYFNYGEDMIQKIAHRGGHDFRYSINMEKLENLGFKNNHQNLEEEISKLCTWYKQNENWWETLKNE